MDSGLGNAPVLTDSVANFQCRAANRYYGGDHVIFLGAVEAYAYNRQEPLLFAQGGFGRFISDDGKRLNRGTSPPLKRGYLSRSRRDSWLLKAT